MCTPRGLNRAKYGQHMHAPPDARILFRAERISVAVLILFLPSL
jgi:hypothetical protein